MFKLHLDLCLVTFVWLRTNEPRYLPGSSSLLCMSFCSGTPIPQLLKESSHYCTHKQGHLSNSVNPRHFKQFNKWSALLFPGQDSLCIKRNMYSTISAIFFYLVLQPICLYPLPLKEKKIIQLSWCGEISLLRSTASVCAGLSCTSNKILCRLQT